MSTKKFILNADDFGMSKGHNRAVLEGFQFGILKSASLAANGEEFEDSIKNVIPSCEGLDVGVHLNIIEGKSLSRELNLLTDNNGNFNNSFLNLLIKSYVGKNKTFLEQVEQEFRAQIDKVKSNNIKITHLDSHVHTHAIPPIFDIVCKLAKEYGINQVRTQFEQPYIVPDIFIHLNATYFINLIKVCLLNCFTIFNKNTIQKYGLKTNDFLIGVSYTSMMNSLTVSYGLLSLKNKNNITAEALIHPCRYEEGIIDNHFAEFQITKNKKLKEKIDTLGFDITNYAEIETLSPEEEEEKEEDKEKEENQNIP